MLLPTITIVHTAKSYVDTFYTFMKFDLIKSRTSLNSTYLSKALELLWMLAASLSSQSVYHLRQEISRSEGHYLYDLHTIQTQNMRNKHKQTSISREEFEPTISVCERAIRFHHYNALQPPKQSQSATLKMDSIRSSETSVNITSTRSIIPCMCIKILSTDSVSRILLTFFRESGSLW